MADLIRIRRGNFADLPTLDTGEFGLCTDTGELFIGTAAGNIQVSMSSLSDQRWQDSSQQRQDLRDAADGYGVLIFDLETKEDQRWSDSSQQRQDLRDAADGYALQTGLDDATATENQRWSDSSQQRQDLRDAADGYATLIGADFTGDVNIQPGNLSVGGESHLDGYTIVDSNFAVTGQMIGNSPPTLIPTGTTQTVDFDNGNAQIINLSDATGDVTLTFINAHSGTSYVIKVIQDSAVARDIVWPANVKWAGGVVPVVSAANDSEDIFTFYFDGSAFYGSVGQNYS